MKPPNSSSVLPKRSQLSPQQLGFLDQHFKTPTDLLNTAPLLSADLTQHCSHLDADLLNLQRHLTKCAVSWISLSFGAKASIHNLNRKLENLSLFTSQYGVGSKMIGKILGDELPKLVKGLRRIENLRKYVETALQLEALVGDLEDAVFFVGNHRAGNMFSATLSILLEFEQKQERFSQAVKAMNTIEELLLNVVNFQPQWRRLLESVDIRVDKTLAVLRPQLLADHRALLASLGWPPKLLSSKIESGDVSSLPNPLVLMQGDKQKGYSQSFLALCALQHLQTRREDRLNNLWGQKECDAGLWAIDELVSPIASRMEYHFLRWVEQPEFIFALVYKITSDFIVGVDDVLQPLIDRARLVSYSAKEAWVSAMVQKLSGFLAKKVFSALAERYKEKLMRSEVASSWLHLIGLIVAFDKRMQSLVNSEIDPFFGESELSGALSRGMSILMIFSDRPDWLKIWAKMELKDAWKKLKAEMKDERVWLIDKNCGVDFQIGAEAEQFLLSTREDHKAPSVAELALKIAWKMIERCQTLPNILSRIQFIRLTAARFLWYFFNRLLLRCKKTELLPDNPEGDALIRVCGSINAARYVESKLQEWSDDVNFLEMRIAESDSNIITKDSRVDNSCFFGEEIKSLAELETNWLMEIIAVILRQFESLSWEYVHYFWQGQEHVTPIRVSATTNLSVSIDFVQALDSLRSNLLVLKSSLNLKDFLDLWRSVADSLDHFISRSIFTNNTQFSSEGIIQFEADMQALFLVFQPFCARPESFFPCIRETLKLLKWSKEETKRMQVVLSNSENGKKYLQSCGIPHLSLDQVLEVLRSRQFES